MLWIKLLYPIPYCNITSFSTNGSNALDVLLRLNPRKYKYNAYLIRKGLVLSRSNIYTLFNPIQL
jgi:hypothetical protein